ncbi:tetratricopeptide repeat protein 23 isoform X2 [Salarias fasciatus]|nr:tetratricopeptide repeat protein 23 isoform X2 [Salarias fasciatus]
MDEVKTKTRTNSSESTAESPESVGSTIRSVDVYPDCGSDVDNSFQAEYARKEFAMLLPEEKLKYYSSRAQARADNQDFGACIQDLVRCVALTRLLFGDSHLKLAQAQARLVEAYLLYKGWGLQAKEHAARARELLLFCSSMSSCTAEKQEIRTCLLGLHLTQGAASLITGTLEEAESSFLEAEHVLEDLRSVINQEEVMKTQLEIFTGLCRVYRGQGRPEEALSQCEKSLQLLKESANPEKTCSVYKDMAGIEQDRGLMDRAVEHLSKAHAIAMSHGLEELEGARISHSLALILSAAAEPHHNESAGQYFEQSLSSYRTAVGELDPAFLTAQDDFCRFLLISGEKKRCVEIQRASVDSKRSAFGDLSAEVADTLQLIGSVEMTEGRLIQAHRTMTKCLKIQSLLYGPQHKKTRATQKAVDVLAR